MNNVYDILLNFNKQKFYKFFEWSCNDKITHIKKIPVFKISNDQMNKLFFGNVKINNSFLEKIFNKTEFYTSKRINSIQYCAIFGNDEDCVALVFNKNGYEIFRSDLIIDEKDEVIDMLKNMDLCDINFISISQINKYDYVTRYEYSNMNIINDELKKAYNSNDIGKLKYIYYELYGIYEFDKDIIYNKINSDINSEWSCKHEILMSIFKILNTRKQI